MLEKINDDIKTKMIFGFLGALLLILVLMFAPYATTHQSFMGETVAMTCSGFAFAFGGKMKLHYSGSEGVENEKVSVDLQGGILTIFIFILLLAVLGFVMYKQIKGDLQNIPMIATYAVALLFTFITTILIFCAKSIVSDGNGEGLKLGWGAILGGIIGLVATALIGVLTAKEVVDKKYLNKFATNKVAAEPQVETNSIEGQIKEIKRLYDDGLITEEQYEKKKNDILFKE